VKLGTLMWTGSAAGWAVLAYLTRLPEAAYVSVGCVAVSYVWYWTFDNNEN